MLQKMKKIVSILIIVIALPYIITRFWNGEAVNSSDSLLRKYCIYKLSQEVSRDYEMEMLKVQAVLVRTTVYQEVEKQGEAFLAGLDFDDFEKMDFMWGKKIERAWNETQGQVILYEDQLALVPFHQVSNGKTRSGQEVLGTDSYPYLKVIECPNDAEAANQITSTFVDAKDISVTAYDSAGYALEVKVGEDIYEGESFREEYQLPSSCMEVQSFEKNTRIITKGVGHGLGLSQYTANEMAKDGKTYEEILQYFFEGTQMKEVAEIFWETE